MRNLRRWAWTAAAAVLVGGCSERPEHPQAPRPSAPAPSPAAVAAGPSPEEVAAALARAQLHADSVERVLRQVRGLSGKERRALRRDVNRIQIARARSLGVRAGDEEEIERLASQGRLVELGDSTPYWVVRELKASVPYVTPDTHAMLLELGRRFQAELDSLGLPPFRMEVTSVMRTPETQARLRRVNRNASKIVSAHEFGTTLDVSHLRFAAPADPVPPSVRAATPALPLPVAQAYATSLDSLAVHHSGQLEAVLGRVLQRMKGEGKVMVMMERQQAVYHMTVARRYPDGSVAAAAE